MYLKYLLPIVGISALLLSGSPALAQMEKAPRIHSGSPVVEGYYGNDFAKYIDNVFNPRNIGADAVGVRLDVPLGKSAWSAGAGMFAGYHDTRFQTTFAVGKVRSVSVTAEGRIAFHIRAGRRFDPYLAGFLRYGYTAFRFSVSGSSINMGEMSLTGRLGAGCRFALNPRTSLMAEVTFPHFLLAGGVSVRLKPRT